LAIATPGGKICPIAMSAGAIGDMYRSGEDYADAT
jgi:hypothetical protein